MAVVCPSCAAENQEGKRFCGDCGAALGLVCSSCGAAVDPGKRFCGDCGAPVAGGAAPAAPAGDAPDAAKRVAERRLTTILFGDLVGFTTLAEARDAEDTRDLLSQYFATANTVVARYGGTIEKFIGDAVMAVWGVPIAHEDDAERAVRAGLDLIAEVTSLADKVHISDLSMRVGIVTGEVAVTLGAVGEGMVAGDAVNTAARIQAAAEPGQVWVDETTRTLTSAAGDVHGGRRSPPEGEGRTHPPVLGASDRCQRRWRAARRWTRGAVPRTRPRAPSGEGALPRLDRRRPPEAGGCVGSCRGRQDEGGVGAREVRRRHLRRRAVASRPGAVVRRRRQLLGAGRDGAHPFGCHRRRVVVRGRPQAHHRARATHRGSERARVAPAPIGRAPRPRDRPRRRAGELRAR